MSSIHIQRTVDNIPHGTTAYTPVIELIVNAIQSIAEAEESNGIIQVEVLRSGQADMIDPLRAVEGFSVTDNGTGFNQKNREAFDQLYTDNKASEGGKGFGRFTCLKYFASVEVESVFVEGDQRHRRTFKMGRDRNIIVDDLVTDAEDHEPTGAVIRASGPRSSKFPDKGLDVIARVLVEKLLPYLVDRQPCPRIIVRDGEDGRTVVLNDYLRAEDSLIEELPVAAPDFTLPRHGEDADFHVRVFKFYFPRTHKSKIALVAHRREVTDVTLVSYIPEFAEEFADPSTGGARGRNYIIKAYVWGDYLDDNVSLERGGFKFHRESEALLGISRGQIEAAAAEIARTAVGEELFTRRERKIQQVRDYVVENAPWHSKIVEQSDLSSLTMNPTKQDIEIHLQTEKFNQEVTARREVETLLASTDIDSLGTKVAEVVEKLSETGKNDLIHYVSLRHCVLDLFRKSLELDEEGHYRSEANVHDIIIPRRRDSDDLDYNQHNLWILDERLNFASFLTSDQPMNGPGSARADLAVFNHKIAYRVGDEPSNPIIIFEFKRPQREDFTGPSAEDPVAQIVRYVNDFRDKKFKTPAGRNIRVEDSTMFYGYVVCDLTPKVERWLEREKNFTRMPDGLGWFDWMKNINLYIEVLSWEKLGRDAEMRNKIFFHKLGI
jgi:hypothetical protein